MSCNWDIKCVDCNERHHFHDMNHEERVMLALIRHAGAIAALDALASDPEAKVELVIAWRGWRVDTAFFKKHQGHHLRPIDEYGRLLGDCTERVECPSCGAVHPCKLPEGHETKGESHR
jgi:hypothetical protein